MVNRVVCVTLLVLLTAIHAQLWLGNGSMAYVHELQQQINDQYAANALKNGKRQIAVRGQRPQGRPVHRGRKGPLRAGHGQTQ